MRLEVKEGQHGCTLINDSYNSDINSLDIALDFMNRRPDNEGRKRTLILSDIYQSGMTGEALYKEVSALCEKRGVEKFIGIGPKYRHRLSRSTFLRNTSSTAVRTLSTAVSLADSATN